MKNLGIVFLLMFSITFTTQVLSADLILPIPKPEIDQEAKKKVAKKKLIYPQKKPIKKEKKVEAQESEISIDVSEELKEEVFIYPEKKPKFINVVIDVSTNLSPEDLASVLIFVEKKLERIRTKKNEPRTCDIDIIDYNGKVMDFTHKSLIFQVPHEKIIYRNFVLFPLQEIAPNWIHPKTKDSIDGLISKLSIEDKNSILKIKKP